MAGQPAVVSDDYLPGDPSHRVIGKPEEQAARVHRPAPPKPTRTARGILADIRLRMAELEPLVAEVPRLEEALKRLEDI